jgi:uncharacterized phiE125 gp8 family phage protein
MELLRLHCRIDEDDARDDSVLTLYAWASIRQGEFETNRVWLDSQWTMTVENFPQGAIVIPKSPCTEVSGIVYVNDAGSESGFAEYSFAPSSQQWDGGRPYAVITPDAAWPEKVAGVTVTFRAGWLAGIFPQDLAQWILVKVAGRYEQREDLASATRKVAIPFPRHFADSLLDTWYLPK